MFLSKHIETLKIIIVPVLQLNSPRNIAVYVRTSSEEFERNCPKVAIKIFVLFFTGGNEYLLHYIFINIFIISDGVVTMKKQL